MSDERLRAAAEALDELKRELIAVRAFLQKSEAQARERRNKSPQGRVQIAFSDYWQGRYHSYQAIAAEIERLCRLAGLSSSPLRRKPPPVRGSWPQLQANEMKPGRYADPGQYCCNDSAADADDFIPPCHDCPYRA